MDEYHSKTRSLSLNYTRTKILDILMFYILFQFYYSIDPNSPNYCDHGTVFRVPSTINIPTKEESSLDEIMETNDERLDIITEILMRIASLTKPLIITYL